MTKEERLKAAEAYTDKVDKFANLDAHAFSNRDVNDIVSDTANKAFLAGAEAEAEIKWVGEIQKAVFWSKCDYGDYCWEWKGSKNKDRYGQHRIGSKIISAHRISYQIINGIISDKSHVLHECDNPSCINPSHLFLGNHLDNMIDKSYKNRGRSTRKSSKFVGVGFRHDINRWRCYVKPYGKKKVIHLGSFEKEYDAAIYREGYILKSNINAKLNFTP